jgi:hypothetical protein
MNPLVSTWAPPDIDFPGHPCGSEGNPIIKISGRRGLDSLHALRRPRGRPRHYRQCPACGVEKPARAFKGRALQGGRYKDHRVTPGSCSACRSGAWRAARAAAALRFNAPCCATACPRKVGKSGGDGLCRPHLLGLRAHGDPLGGPAVKALRAGRHLSDGYVYVAVPGRGNVGEHRLISERRLGRPLRREETVHHKIGQRADNRENNLELWSSSQPAGQRVEDKVVWAVELLTLYAPARLRALGQEGREAA